MSRRRRNRMLVAVLILSLVPLTAAYTIQQKRGEQSHFERGIELLRENRLPEAKVELLNAVRVTPGKAEVHNALGSVYDRMGEVDNAIAEYRRAIKLSPGSAPVYNNLGIAHLRKGETTPAIQAFRQALELDHDNVTASYNLGIVLLRSGKHGEAVPYLESARSKAPGDAGILYNLGTAYLERGDPQACVELFEMAPPGLPLAQVPEIQVLRGAALARLNRLDEAEQHLEAAIRLNPEVPEPYFRLGLVFEKKGAWSQARDALERAMQRSPAPPGTYFVALGEVYRNLGMRDKAIEAFRAATRGKDPAAGHMALGSLLLGAKLYDQAAREFESALAAASESAEARFNLALALHRQGKNEEALAQLETLPAAERTAAHHQLTAAALSKLQRWTPALEALRDASRLQPYALELYLQMGVILLNVGAAGEALELLSKVAEKHPDSATIQVGLAQVYMATDRYPFAKKCLEEAIRLAPGYEEPLFLMGNLHKDITGPAEAEPFYRRAIALTPDRAEFHFNLGLALAADDRRDEALAEFRKANSLQPSAEAQYRIASIHYDRNAYAEAEAELTQGLKLEPDHTQSHYLMFQLYMRQGQKERAAQEKALFDNLKKKANNEKPAPPDVKSIAHYLSYLR